MNQSIELLRAFIRVISLNYFIEALILLTYLPDKLVMVAHGSRLPMSAETAQVAAATLGIRFFLYLAVAVALWTLARPIARFIGKSLLASSGPES